MTPENKALMERYPQYYVDVSHLEVIDVYRVIDLFKVTDPTAQHALKKLLLSGRRTGGKPIETDLKEARDTLSRGLAMRAEDANKGQLPLQFAVNSGPVTSNGPTIDPKIIDALLKPARGDNALPNPAPMVRFCNYTGCEMRVRDENSDRCMIHSAPVKLPSPPTPPVGSWQQVDKEDLCKDEGCPHHGNDHVCVTPQPRQNRSAGAMPRRPR